MKVQVKNRMEYGLPKGGIVDVKKQLPDTYVGEFFNEKRNRTDTVIVKKYNCVVIEK